MNVIFCRNVIMYLAAECAQRLVQRIFRALRPGGYLFLGHAETLRGLSNAFSLEHTHGTFYYRRCDSDPEVAVGTKTATRRAVQPAVPVLEDTGTWVDAIRNAKDRIDALSRSCDPGAPARAASEERRDLASTYELLARERYSEALASVDKLPEPSARNPDVLLLRAVLLVHGGQLSVAQEACKALLAIDQLNAGAHYVLALCHEGAIDRDAAESCDRTAVYLDPSFAMPRLHLGLLARRAGDREAARRELGQALVLLRREDPSRLLLFGGGFDREALITFCEAELRASGGTP